MTFRIVFSFQLFRQASVGSKSADEFGGQPLKLREMPDRNGCIRSEIYLVATAVELDVHWKDLKGPDARLLNIQCPKWVGSGECRPASGAGELNLKLVLFDSDAQLRHVHVIRDC